MADVLLFVWAVVAGLGCDRLVVSLGDGDYAVRERAARRVPVWVAYPLLTHAAVNSTDPETRLRCHQLAAPVASTLADLRALWYLIAPAPDPVAFWADDDGRRRLYAICERHGIGLPWERKKLHPENDEDAWICWMMDRLVYERAGEGLNRVRGWVAAAK